MPCISPRTLHCLRTEGHFGLLSIFRIVTLVRNVGHKSMEDAKEKAKGLKIFQILPSKGMNVAIARPTTPFSRSFASF